MKQARCCKGNYVNSVNQKMSHIVAEGSSPNGLIVLYWLFQDDRGTKNLTQVLICT
jgi:hypothetical protein